MKLSVSSVSIVLVAAGLLWSAAPPVFSQQEPPLPPPAPEPQPTPPPPSPRDSQRALMEENQRLRADLAWLRQELADARLSLSTCERERRELQLFIDDNRELGDAYREYTTIREVAEREAKRREADEARARRDAERAQREAQRLAAAAQREAQRASADRVAEYRRHGYSPVGLGIYVSRISFAYEMRDNARTRIVYDPLVGRIAKPRDATEVDYNRMLISGNVINGTNEVRNIGVAVTFFDDNGNQVGHEIIQIANARPDVPYPFTSRVDMALNRPFDSSSAYVLYADVAVDAPPEE